MNFKVFPLLLFALSSVALTAKEGIPPFYIIANGNISANNTLYVNFLNPDYEAWSKPYNTFSFGGGCTFGINNTFGIGLHFEGEQVKFDNYSIGANADASRFVFGAHFEAAYPKKVLHMINGGFINYGKLKSDDFKFKLNGFEYGIYIGPELSIKQFDLSLLFRPKFSYFYSTGVERESVLILNPSLSVRLTFSLATPNSFI